MFAQDDRRSRKIERVSQLLLSLSNSFPRQPLAQSAPLLRRNLEKTHRQGSLMRRTQREYTERISRIDKMFGFCLLKDSNPEHPIYRVKVIPRRSRIICEGSFSSGSKETAEQARGRQHENTRRTNLEGQVYHSTVLMALSRIEWAWVYRFSLLVWVLSQDVFSVLSVPLASLGERV